jgi:hypothetical protein
MQNEDRHKNMMGAGWAGDVFHKGDEVVLAEGTYQGTHGVFLRLKPDAQWADITERNGGIRSHPVEWLAHSTDAIRGSGTDDDS